MKNLRAAQLDTDPATRKALCVGILPRATALETKVKLI